MLPPATARKVREEATAPGDDAGLSPRGTAVADHARPIAFLYPAFPVLHQTFVMWEALALKREGLRLQFWSLQRPNEGKQQPEGAVLAKEVHYLPGALSPAVLAANLRCLWQRPASYLRGLSLLVRHWYRDRKTLAKSRAAASQSKRVLSWSMRLEALWNTSPSVYLLKSLSLVPQAIYLGERLIATRVAHVHAHWATHATTVALLLRWVYGIRFSFTAHAYDIYLMPLLLPAKLRAAELVVTCAQVNVDYLRRLAGNEQTRIVVNYHGVDLQRFHPRPRTHDKSQPRIVSCGSLRLYKGHHVLIEACALLPYRVECVIIGEGPQRPLLEKQVRRLGLTEWVRFTGSLIQQQVAEEYAQADLFVLASVLVEESGRQDVIPNVLVEAMAMGIPVVASDLPGIRELIQDRVHGRLVPPENPRVLAGTIDELLKDPDQRAKLGQRGRARVLEAFDRERNVRALAELLASFRGCCPEP